MVDNASFALLLRRLLGRYKRVLRGRHFSKLVLEKIPLAGAFRRPAAAITL